MRGKVRTLRHWKQRFNKNAEFVWRKSVKYNGQQMVLGSAIPKQLADSPTKLRRFWESGVIELAEFDEPNVLTGESSKSEKSPKKPPIKRKKSKQRSIIDGDWEF